MKKLLLTVLTIITVSACTSYDEVKKQCEEQQLVTTEYCILKATQ